MTIDWWTLGLQTVNVVILIWLLQHFFWKPIAAMIAERRATAQKALSEAQDARDKAKAALADIEKTRAGFGAERDKYLADARRVAEEASKATSLLAKQDAEAMTAAAEAAIAKDADAATRAWASRSSDLAIDIARRLAARLEGPRVNRLFLDWALAAIRALPESTRRVASQAGVTLEASSATPLSPDEQKQAIDGINDAFGARVRLAFKTDPELIAGLELRTDHLLISNSWRADLAQILTELGHVK